MGCWDGTCGLTNLPIIHGEQMFVFPIAEQNRSSFCYSTALFRPSILPFRAKYDDYGGGEDCHGVGLPYLMEGIRNGLIEREVGENKYHDIAIKKEGFDVDSFFKACHKKRLQFPNPMRGYEDYPETTDVFFTMIRKDVVDRLWTDWSFEMYKPRGMVEVPEGFESDKYSIKGVTYGKLFSLVPQYMEQRTALFREDVRALKAELPEGQLSDDDLAVMLYRPLRDFFSRDQGEPHLLSEIFDHAFGSGYCDGGFFKLVDLATLIIGKYASGATEEAFDIIQDCLVGYMVNSFMESTRVVWMPPMHQGTQSEQHDEYLVLNSIVNDIIKERKAEYDEY